MTHTLKTLQPYFRDAVSGKKSFEIRKFDRPFKVGDFLILQEFDGENYTDKEQIFEIDYVLTNCPQYGLMEGYCILAISFCE